LFTQKQRSSALLIVANIFAMSLWFIASAILPDMLREVMISPFRQAALASAVQVGFVSGALVIALIGLADRYDPRWIFCFSALMASFANYLLIYADIGSDFAIGLRFVVGLFLSGVYPVAMKIAIGWGQKDRGFMAGLVVGALTIGAAVPHLFSFLGGAEWRYGVIVTSCLGVTGGLLVLATKLGPFDVRGSSFNSKAIGLAWSNKLIRYAYLGYLCHMWELYAMWTWLSTLLGVSFFYHYQQGFAEQLASLVTFWAIALGGVAAILAGRLADRYGKANITIYAMLLSGGAALGTALSFGGPVWLTIFFAVIWGITIIPDSAQFSALVADDAPGELSGSLLTLQIALGFTLTIFTVQVTPVAALIFGWPTTIVLMALGPFFGIFAMRRYQNFADSK